MKTKILVICFMSWCGHVHAEFDSFLNLKKNASVVMGGDSIETSYMYSHYVMAWFQLTYPDLDLQTYVVARSGSGLGSWASAGSTAGDSFYERYAFPLSPALFLLKMGDNGGQMPDEHLKSYNLLIQNWIDPTETKLVILGANPRQKAADSIRAEGKNDAEAEIASTHTKVRHAHTFDGLGKQWMENWENKVNIQQVGVDPQYSGGTRDFVHPGPAGNLILAVTMLRRLGVDTLVSRARLDYGALEVKSSAFCVVDGLQKDDSGFSFDRLDKRLPMPVDKGGIENANLFCNKFPLPDGPVNNWQNYEISVEGLPAGEYSVKCDNILIGEVSSKDLAAGWNMASLQVGPVYDQIQEVLGCIRDLQYIDRINGAGLGSANYGTIADYHDHTLKNYQQGGIRGKAYFDLMQPIVRSLDLKMAAIHNAADPKKHRYLITRIGDEKSEPNRPTGLSIKR